MEEEIKCELCQQMVPNANMLIHSARCDKISVRSISDVTGGQNSLDMSLSSGGLNGYHNSNDVNTSAESYNSDIVPTITENETSVVEETTNLESFWSCPMCTLDNQANILTCEACDTPAPFLQDEIDQDVSTILNDRVPCSVSQANTDNANENNIQLMTQPTCSSSSSPLPPSSAYSSSTASNLYISNNNNNNNISDQTENDLNHIMTSTLLGAVSGASLAAVSNRNVWNGLFSGAGAGAILGIFGAMLSQPVSPSTSSPSLQQSTTHDTDYPTPTLTSPIYVDEDIDHESRSMTHVMTTSTRHPPPPPEVEESVTELWGGQLHSTVRRNPYGTSYTFRYSSVPTTTTTNHTPTTNTTSTSSSTAGVSTRQRIAHMNENNQDNTWRTSSSTTTTNMTYEEDIHEYYDTSTHERVNTDNTPINSNESVNMPSNDVTPSPPTQPSLYQIFANDFLRPFLSTEVHSNLELILNQIFLDTMNNSSADHTPVHLTQEDIDNLPKKVMTSELLENAPTCYVCLEDYHVGNTVTCLPCIHKFHPQCIEKWLKISTNCPVCKQNVLTHSSTTS